MYVCEFVLKRKVLAVWYVAAAHHLSVSGCLLCEGHSVIVCINMHMYDLVHEWVWV